MWWLCQKAFFLSPCFPFDGYLQPDDVDDISQELQAEICFKIEAVVAPPAKKAKKMDTYNRFLDTKHRQTATQTDLHLQHVDREKSKYKCLKREFGNAYDFWRTNENKYPTVARKLLGIPVSSASIERVWSAAGEIDSARWARLTIEHFQNLMFCNYKTEFIPNRKNSGTTPIVLTTTSITSNSQITDTEEDTQQSLDERTWRNPHFFVLVEGQCEKKNVTLIFQS